MLDTGVTVEPPQFRCTCMSPGYQPAGATSDAMTVSVPESTALNAPEVTWIVAVPGACPVNAALLTSFAGIRSPSTTPPVFVDRLQPSAATLATKFPYGSRVIAYAVTELPTTTFCAGTTTPLPSLFVSTSTTLGSAGLTVNALEFVPVSEPSVAVSVIAVPAVVGLRLLNV